MTSTEIPQITYTIAKSDTETAISRVNKANKRAARIGLPGYTYTITTAEPMPIYDEVYDSSIGGFVQRGIKPLFYIEMIDFTVIGMVPRLGDWEVLAILEDDENAGIISRALPGAPDIDLSSLKIDGMACDHCHKIRARVKTYVLRDTAGNLVKVGKSCLSDYTGIRVSGRFDLPCQSLDEEIDDLVSTRGHGFGDFSVPVLELLELATGAIKLHGWKSKTQAMEMGGTPTSAYVHAAYGRSINVAKIREELFAAADFDKAADVLDYCRTLEKNGTEYINNLIACTEPEMVSVVNFGLVISAIACYDRHQADLVKAAIAAESTHVGTVGTRMTFTGVKVLDVKVFPGYYSGTSELVKMITTEGQIITWSTKSSGMRTGDVVDITARIKAHKTFRGTCETAVSNVKQI